MRLTKRYSGFCWLASILFLTLVLGCGHRQSLAGNYSGQFDWQNGLRSVNLVLDSDNHRTLELKNTEIRRQVEVIIQDQVKSANLTIAQGRITISVLGDSPFLISLQRFEINVPDFAELQHYVETQNIDGIRRFEGRYHNLNQRDLPRQSTALFHAAAEPDVGIVQALLALGADPNIPDFEGDTPLIIAVMADRDEVARQLIHSGADVNHADKAGGTPLMRAVKLGRSKLLTLLLQSGADPNYVAPNGESALQMARNRGDRKAIVALQKAGASK